MSVKPPEDSSPANEGKRNKKQKKKRQAVERACPRNGKLGS
jgi:hypothetical protein